MYQDLQPSPHQLASSNGGFLVTGGNALNSESDDWSKVKNPGERRKIQNKMAQRRRRELKCSEDVNWCANKCLI
jgi:hypothetical protein